MKNHKLMVDAGFLFALLSKSDLHHLSAQKIKNQMRERQWVSTWPVITEVVHLLIKREHGKTVDTFMEFCKKGGIEIFQLNLSHLPKLQGYMKKYQDLPMDLADASLVILADELQISDIVSTDIRDFQTYRWMSHKPFRNLLSTI